MANSPERDLQDGLAAFARGDMAAAVPLLTAAAEASAPGTAARSEVLQRLGSALARTGRFAEADTTLTGSAEAAKDAGDQGSELRALIERMIWRIETKRATPDEAVALAESALPVFERLGDELGLAKAWHLIGDEHVAPTWGASTEGLERALVHARRAGDQREIADILWWLGVDYHFGPMPADEAIRRCEELRGMANGDRTVEAGMLGMLAGLTAMQGRFAEARDLFARALDIMEELGMALRMATRRTISGGIELLADDPVAAERELRWGYQRLGEMGAKVEAGGIAAQLAEALYRQGRYDEADRFAAKDVKAKLLARNGDLAGAESLAREFVAAADRDDNPNRRGVLRRALAEVLLLGGRHAEAMVVLDEAREQFEAKRNVAAVAQVERLRSTR